MSVDVELFRSLEEELWRGSGPGRAEILNEDFQEFCRFGHVYDKDQIASATSEGVTVEFPFESFEVEQLADTVVLVTYVNEVTNKGVTERARRSSIWVLSGSDWSLRFQQATTLPAEN